MYILFGSTSKHFGDTGGGDDYLIHSNIPLNDFIKESYYFLCDKFDYPETFFWAHIFDTITLTVVYRFDCYNMSDINQLFI